MRIKAELRALRESAGITQSSFARELGVEVRSVKRWENPDEPQVAPQDAWDIVDIAMDNQRLFVGIVAQSMEGATEATLPYWRSQDQYEEHGGDLYLKWAEDFREANASLRALGAVLRSKGIIVHWMEGGEYAGVFPRSDGPHPEFGASEADA